MVLAEEGAVPDIKGRLDELFYRRQGLPSGVYVCTPAPAGCDTSPDETLVASPTFRSTARPPADQAPARMNAQP
jgi:hypothetical protein